MMLPWIRIANLASHMLGCCQRPLPEDWLQRYTIRPVLLETLCEIPRFTETRYQAVNWIRASQTQDRGKLDMHNQYVVVKWYRLRSS